MREKENTVVSMRHVNVSVWTIRPSMRLIILGVSIISERPKMMSLIDGLIISERLQPTRLSTTVSFVKLTFPWPKHFKTTLMAASKGNSSRSFVAGIRRIGRSEDRGPDDHESRHDAGSGRHADRGLETGALVYLSGPVLLGDFKNYSYPYLPNLTDPRIP
jgi:hypothetical protein